jgi:hypothetical protein
MRQFDREKLRKELIQIYSDYLKDPTDIDMKKRARMLHTSYGNAGKLVDKVMRQAVNTLVNIGWNLPEPPKPSKKAVQKLVYSLAARKV